MNEPAADWDVIVIGAGAAGLLAATRAAERGRRTLLLEKNRKPGVKILMSGGTRCNLTQATDRRGIVAAFGDAGSFLHSALARLGPRDLVALVEAEGVPTKTEATGKIFPSSDRAADILFALLRRCQRSGCRLQTEAPVTHIDRDGATWRVATTQGAQSASSLVVTTGGQSYPRCGTRGDGYAWADALGHTVHPRRPALVPVVVSEAWVHELRGITISDAEVRVAAANAGPPRTRQRGSVLFTHFGLSGPAVLDVSRAVSDMPAYETRSLICDFVPDVSEQQLLERLAGTGKHTVASLLTGLLPKRLQGALLTVGGIDQAQRAAEFGKAARAQLVRVLKQMPLTVTGTLGFDKAEVTAGGVALDEVDSRTMQSRHVPGLYFAGEILDLDGPIGGYNFQAAFSTGWLAGESV